MLRTEQSKGFHYYTEIFENSSDIIYLVEVTDDRRFIHLDVNTAFHKGMGLPKEAIVGRYVDELENHAFRETLIQKYTACLDAGTKTDFIGEYCEPSGVRTLHSVLSPIRDENGRIHRITGIAREISDRTDNLTMQKELFKREQLLDSLVENVPNDIARWDCEGQYLYLNPAHERTLGKPASDIIGTHIPQEHTVFKAALAQVIATKKQVYVQQEMPSENGVIEIHDVILLPEYDETKHVVSILGIGQNNTARYQMENELALQEEQYRTLVDSLPDNILRYDRDCRTTYISPALERIGGKEAVSFLMGKTPMEAHLLEDEDQAQRYHNKLAHTIATGTTNEIDITTSALHGASVQTHHIRFIPERNPNGEIFGALIIGHDITQQKRMESELVSRERAFHSLAENLPDNIVRWNCEGQYLYLNPIHERTLGKSAAEVLGTFLPDSHSEVKAAIRQVALTGEQVTVSQTITTKEGNTEYHEVSIAPERDPSGKIISVLGIGRNVTEQKQIKMALEKSEQSLKEAQRIAHVGSWDVDIVNDILTWSDETYRMWEIDKERFAATFEAFLETVHPEDRNLVTTAYNNSLINHSLYDIEHRLLFPDGRIKYIHERGEPYYDTTGKPVRFIGVSLDITERKQQEEQLHKTKAKLSAVISTIPDLIWVKDAKGVYIMCNLAFENFFGATCGEIIGKTDYDFISREQADFFRQKDHETMEKGEMCINEEEVVFAQNGQNYLLETRKIPVYNGKEFMGILGIGRDITDRKASEEKIEHMAHHDALTQLPNRVLARKKAQHVIAQTKRAGAKAAFLFIDLDGFKDINDSLGHSAGDILLMTIASRLNLCIQEHDTISRQGGDEFLIILSEIQDEAVIMVTTEKILKELAKPFEIATHTLSISGSIGIALYPDHGESFETLLQNADTAMYKAKETGKNGYHVYTQQMSHNMIGQLQIQNDLKSALQHNEFILFYQPQIDLTKNKITGVEALIRWQHPQKGMIPPMSFIPIAESSGMIVQIGQWVIEEACRQAALWQKKGIKICVAVNISAMQFKRGNLEEVVKNALIASQLDPKWLELELTESVMMHDAEKTLQSIRNLKALGVQLSIDDFGTGYSSLAYLKRFSVDKLKIDQSFIRDILNNQEDSVIVQTIIQMSKNLNLLTIAEGVENQEISEVVKNFGCDEVQGYHFAKPMEASALEKFFMSYS